MRLELETTWDGRPVSREKPYAVSVVVWRQVGEREFLVPHRRHAGGEGYEGDWAWTPPSGARLPDEHPDDAARRELLAETGLAATSTPTRCRPSDEVALHIAEAPLVAEIVLDDEHDRYAWLPLDEAMRRCLPAVVGAGLAAAADWVDKRR